MSISIKKFYCNYGENKVLKNINLKVQNNQVLALIGPSGCGKSTLLRSINRLNDLIDKISIQGKVLIDKKNIYDEDVDVTVLRRRVGMVFQKPNPFPKSIFENISFGLKIKGVKSKTEIEDRVESSLKKVGLWKEVQDRLNDTGLSLSGGQAQRLCIARTIAVQPEIILMDEPTSALDPLSTQIIEERILELKEQYTVIIVTHNMQQAARISDHTAFLYLGELIEQNPTNRIFTNPNQKLTEEYVTGRFG